MDGVAFVRQGIRVKAGRRNGGRRNIVHAALLAGAAASSGPPPLAAQAIQAEALERAQSGLLRTGGTGAVMAVVQGSRIETRAVGHVDTARTAAMREDALLGTGSLVELYAALVGILLEERGIVDLDAPIRRWASDLPPGIGALTLRQILSHTAGLDDARYEPPRRPPGPVVWPGATDRALFTEPGAIHSPSRHGPPFARALLAAAAGTTWERLLGDVLLDPAGLDRTTPDPAEAEMLGAVPGLLVNTTAEGPLRALRPTRSPLAQILASADDVARLLRIWMADGWDGARRIFPAEPLDRLERSIAVRPADPADSVGMGFRVTRFHGYRQLVHESGIGGYGAIVRWVPERQVGVVILANATGAVLRPVADGVMRDLLGAAPAATDSARPTPARADSRVSQAAPDLATLAGTWANGDRIIVLEHVDGELYWTDGGLRLHTEPRGPWLDVLIGDGRVAESLRTFRDDADRRYLLVGDLAYRLDVSASDRR